MLGLCGLLAAGLSPSRGAVARPVAQGTSAPSPCLAVHNKTAGPATLLLGGTATVTLTVTALCAGEVLPLHIVLVLDASGSMEGEGTFEMKKGARELIKALDLRNNPYIRVGVVSFNSAANILCQLTDNASRVSGCVGKVGASGSSSISSGILAGIRVLLSGRRDLEAPAEDIREVMLVVADGPDSAGCGPVQRAAGQATGQGILLISMSGGPASDVPCMRSIASSPHYALESTGHGHMADVFGQAIAVLEAIRHDMSATALAGLSVTDRLPPNMAYVPGSAIPPPSAVDATASELSWRFAFVPPDGLTITLRVRPLEVGHHATNAGATGVLTDTLGRTGTFAFTDPSILVLNPLPMQTPTNPPQTPTEVPTATGVPTRAASPTPTAVSSAALYFYFPCTYSDALP